MNKMYLSAIPQSFACGKIQPPLHKGAFGMAIIQPSKPHHKGESSMITIFNRRTVYMGTDVKAFNEMRDRLEAAGIKYKYAVKDTGKALGMGKGRSTAFVINKDAKKLLTYEIWVHEKDYSGIK